MRSSWDWNERYGGCGAGGAIQTKVGDDAENNASNTSNDSLAAENELFYMIKFLIHGFLIILDWRGFSMCYRGGCGAGG